MNRDTEKNQSQANWASRRRSFASFLKLYEKPLMVLLASAGLTAILHHVEFNLLEANLYDLKVRAQVSTKPNEDIILVSLDDQTVKDLDQAAPLPLEFHARFMESLERLQPKAVGYLVDLSQVHQLSPDQFQGEWGKRFVDSANRMQANGTTVLLGTPFDVMGEVVPPYPLSSLPHAIAVIHKDGNVFAEDKITRRALVTMNGKPVFHVELAQKTGLFPQGAIPRGTFSVPEIDTQYFFFRYRGDTAIKAHAHVVENYERISFRDLLDNRLPPGALKGKILLVGTIIHDSRNDFAFTPFSRTAYVNPKLLIHANILDSVIKNDGIVLAPTWLNIAITFTSAALVFWWVLTFTPLYGVFSTIILSIVFLATCQLLFQFEGIWIRQSQTLIAILVGYYLAVPYRLIREYKKRWEYQRKNQILVQVEELKTNFLNLVTHDLKTPVARIQGLAEVLLKKSSERLVDRDKETLNHIIDSTDELNRFISSILELSKVESQRMPLKIESKDINQLIERCVDGFKAPARARQIAIKCNLEPLFPIRIDASLISKVMNNLVDNAIKYSPSGSEILVSSREIDGQIEISIKDQGIGMSTEETENLFTKFYRAKNDKTAEIGGTGLGLYLSKYFIEAHGGTVMVQSERGSGSTFMIKLPVEGAQQGAVLEPSSTQAGLTKRIGNLVKSKLKTTAE